MTVPIGKYYKTFRGVHGILGGLSFIPAVIGAVMGDKSKNPNYFYPPLGDVSLIALIGTLAFGILSTYIVFVYCESSQRRLHPVAPVVLYFAAAVGFCVLIGLYIEFVKVVPISSEKTEVTVSTGYDRTAFVSSSRDLANLSDSELLHVRGPWEDQIQKLWTLNSIAVARVSLWIFYTCVLVCLVSISSFGVYQHAAASGAAGG
jgi:hypothetical protein